MGRIKVEGVGGTQQMEDLTASVINIGPVVSGKHIGVSLLIEADSQHLYEKTVDPCSVCRFNSYEHRCIELPNVRQPSA